MKLNKYIDHTLLKAVATEKEITKICEEAKQYDFASVCVNPAYVAKCAELLKGSDVEVCTVIGFPLGANTTAVKVYEVKDAIKNGATEVDMVNNIGKVKDGDFTFVEEEIRALKEAAGKNTLKVILETCYLTPEEIGKSCIAAKAAGADFVKTSTGFGTGGAKVEDVALMRKTVGEKMGVKASGGIHSREETLAMIEAGATRIGASAGIKIMEEE